MLEVREKPRMVERALLIGLTPPQSSNREGETLLDELDGLVRSLGIAVVHRVTIPLRKPQAKFLTGAGQAASIIEEARLHDCDVIVFDDELSPSQQRNWEQLGESKILVVDRHEIILDIFSERAQTSEASLQVELARAEYNLPRLRRAWTHLGRQRGGGTTQRGEGETQLEADRRMVRDRIARLRRDLEAVHKRRAVQRKGRMKVPVPTGSIVGYTNAGKSSLLNALTHADVLVEDKLFATLDPTTRRLKLPNGQHLVLTDTVGFVRRLPHLLVDAFKATLEESVVADFLIHVLDANSTEIERHWETTRQVLREIGAEDKRTLTVFNKIDLLDPPTRKALRQRFPEAILVSSTTGDGLPELLASICATVSDQGQPMELMIPHHRYDLVHFLHEIGAVSRERHTDEGVLIAGTIPHRQITRVEAFAHHPTRVDTPTI